MTKREIDEFLENLSTHDFAVGTEELEEAYITLQGATSDFANVTENTLAEAIVADKTVVREVLRLSASFHSLDSWTTLLRAELPLEHSSKGAVVNEIQRRMEKTISKGPSSSSQSTYWETTSEATVTISLTGTFSKPGT